MVAPTIFPTSIDTEPVHFNGATLASDLYINSNSRAEWYNSTINGTIHFNNGVGELLLFPDSGVVGSGTILADGATGNIRVGGGAVSLSAGITLRSTAGTLSLGRNNGDTLGSYALNGPVEAAGGAITFCGPVSGQNSIVVQYGGSLNLTPGMTLTNTGMLVIQNGGILNLNGPIDNQGIVNVDHSSVLVRSGSIIAAQA